MEQIELLSETLGLKPTHSIRCRKCGSSSLWFSKHMNWGPVMKSYHYKVHCRTCKAKYHTTRTAEIYRLVKDLPWTLSKNARKKKFGSTKQQLSGG